MNEPITQSQLAVTRLETLVSHIATIRITCASKLDAVSRPAPPPLPPSNEGDAPARGAPPLFSDLHAQMDLLETELERIAEIIDRVEL